MTLDQYLEFIQEDYFISDKTISINLDDFISGKKNKLIIAGLSGGGKSTLCRYLAQKYNAQCFETDDCARVMKDDPKVEKIFAYPSRLPPKDIFLYVYKKCVKPKIDNNKRQVIEGGLAWQNYLFSDIVKKDLKDYPTIIIGTSAVKATMNILSRRKNIGKEINLEKIVKATKRNFYQIMGMLKDYRKMKLKEGGDIKEFEIPKLTITDHRR